MKDLADRVNRTLEAIDNYLKFQGSVDALSKGEDGYFWQGYLNTINAVTIELIKRELEYRKEDIEFMNNRTLRETSNEGI